ncbi:hypothetical protein [Sulfobacillus harzensis]|uniref:hypothetical protein n=1 Tax=Sulfobacillus harzensis TaxID=2729629 RepID=UPI001FAC7126|nr:hypothetical protein [Sulfobacillus harzensis]
MRIVPTFRACNFGDFLVHQFLEDTQAHLDREPQQARLGIVQQVHQRNGHRRSRLFRMLSLTTILSYTRSHSDSS